MTLRIAPAPLRYSQQWQAEHDREIVREDLQNVKRNTDVEFADNRLIIQSPNGSRWKISVSDGGVLSAVAL